MNLKLQNPRPVGARTFLSASRFRTCRPSSRIRILTLAAAGSLLLPGTLHAAAGIANVRASQRAGTDLVDIRYDLGTTYTSGLLVSVAVSTNGGLSYTLPATNFSGDVGYGITAGANKLIVWDADRDWPEKFSTNVFFRLTASDSYALRFDGLDDVVMVPYAPELNLTGAFTLEAWVNMERFYAPGNAWNAIMEKPVGSSGQAVGVYVDDSDGRPGLFVGYSYISSQTALTLSVWHHVAAVRQANGSAFIYIDGQSVASGNLSAPASTGYGWMLGCGNGDYAMDGILDEVRIWSIGRSQAAIAATMNRPLTGQESGLVGYWRFNEGTGQVAHDSSPYHNDGQLGDQSNADVRDPEWTAPGGPLQESYVAYIGPVTVDTRRFPPTIVEQPRSVTKLVGETATFSVTATGTPPLANQWSKDGVALTDGGNVSGARSRVLTLANVQWADAGQYTVVVTNVGGSVTSRVANLTVLVPPQILTQPQNQAVAPGANVVFSVTATGTTPLYCQWRKNGVNISGATMAALSFSVRASDLGRYSVVVWNAAGSVVSGPADLVVLADPANGNPPGLLRYSSLPPKQDGKDSLVLVTHGWSVPWEPLPSDVPWLNELTGDIVGYLTAYGLGNWQVVGYKWLANSFTLLPDTAAENGAKEGANMGCDIVNQGWSHVHLIGNSAGAAFIQGAANMIKALNGSIVVHETFLDPYLQVGYPGRSAYGKDADWADCYFAHNFLSDDLGNLVIQPSLTEGRLANAYNVNVTQLDPSAWIIPAYCGNLLDPLRICGLEVSSHHDWPHEFYKNTVSGSQPGAEGLGFPLSKEGGGWANHGSYPLGNQPRVLGTLAMVVQNEVSVVVNGALQLGELASQVSPSGIVQFVQNGFHALTGLGGGSSPKGPQPKGSGGLPVWVSLAVPVTNQVNFVAFEAQFDSMKGAVGLLSVYWGTNLIGTVDERVVVPGQRQYSFALPETAPSGLYLLGFRLDPHSDVQSGVNVTNIAMGFSGTAVPIQLQIARSAPNSNPVITLTAAPGFYYQLQTSPDLLNWTPFASVLNTNGTAQIIDATTNSLQQRFYRAVMP